MEIRDLSGIFNLYTDYSPFGLKITERPETQGLVFVVQNEKRKSVQFTLPEKSPIPKKPELVPIPVLKRKYKPRQRSPASLSRLQAQIEHRRVYEEKRAAELASCRSELQDMQKLVRTLIKVCLNLMTYPKKIIPIRFLFFQKYTITEGQQAMRNTLFTMRKEFEEVSNINEELTREVEELLDQLIQHCPEKTRNKAMSDLMLLCNAVLRRDN